MGRILFIIITFYVYAAGAMDSAGLASLCQSGKTFVLVDVFKRTQPEFGYRMQEESIGMVDIDGDGISDVSHGDLILAQLKDSNIKVVTYGLRAFGGFEIAGALGNIRHLSEINSIENIGAIVLPMSYSRTPSKIGEKMFGNPTMTHEQVLEFFRNPPANYKKYVEKFTDMPRVLMQLNELKKVNIPVLSPAGNRYGTSLNLINLLGEPGVGATIGYSNVPAPYSDHFEWTKIFKPGDVFSVSVEGGIDINNDGTADIPSQFLSGKDSIVAQVESGALKIKSISELKANINEPALIDASEWLGLLGVKDPEVIESFLTNYGDLIHYPSELPFFSHISRQPVFQPAQVSDAVMINKGTSFSMGNICSPSLSF